MLFTAPGAASWISGVILYDETMRQKTRDGVLFPAYLEKHGIIPGIKVDTGAKPLAQFPGETITEGLDGLRERLSSIASSARALPSGAQSSTSVPDIPTDFAIAANAQALARYAALCQEQDIVPIVEPEVLMDGDALDRALRERHRAAPCSRCLMRSSRIASSRRHGAQAQHGDFGQEGEQPRQALSRSPRRRCAASSATCPRRWPASRSSRAVSRRLRRPCTSRS